MEQVDERTVADWDAIVIGSGIGGLTTAAYLTTNGMRTLVLEQHDLMGGCSQVFRRKRRYEFDVGCHYLLDCGPGGILPTVLRGVGLEGRVEFTPMDPDGFDTFVAADRTLRVPVGWDALTERVVEQFPDEVDAATRCLRDLRTIGELTASLYAPSAANVGLELLRSPGATLRTVRSAFSSLDEFMDGYGLSRELRGVLSAYAGLLGVQPSDFPVPVLAFLWDHVLKSGGWYPRGGGQALAANLIEVIRSHGGAVRTQARVEQILISGGRATGVRLEGGETFNARYVVSNADARQTYLNLVGEQHLRRRTVANVKSWRMAGLAVSVYVGVDLDLSKVMPATNYWVMPDYTMQLPVGLHEMPPADQMPVWITSGASKDPDGSFDGRGHSTLEMVTFLPDDDRIWAPGGDGPYSSDERYLAFKQHVEDGVIAQATKVIPAIEGHIVWRESSTPLTHARYTSSSQGAWGGVALSRSQMLTRPRNGTEIKGLYLAGGSTLYGPGITSVARGGLAVAGSILGRNIWREVSRGRVYGDLSRLAPRGTDWDPYFVSKRLAVKPRAQKPPEAGSVAAEVDAASEGSLALPS